MSRGVKPVMKNEHEPNRRQHPAIRKCMKHLDIIGANDKTRQIVYMYMKSMDEEIERLKKQNLQVDQLINSVDNR